MLPWGLLSHPNPHQANQLPLGPTGEPAPGRAQGEPWVTAGSLLQPLTGHGSELGTGAPGSDFPQTAPATARLMPGPRPPSGLYLPCRSSATIHDEQGPEVVTWCREVPPQLPTPAGAYRGQAVGGAGVFAGLDGGNATEGIVALAARALHSPAGVSCSWEGHTNPGV